VSLEPHLLVTEPLEGLLVGAVVPLGIETMHHLQRALRRPEGSAISLTDGNGVRAQAVLVPGGARLVTAPSVEAPRVPRLILAQSLAKGRRTDDAVRMACELGVDRIVPVVAQRTQGRPDARAAEAVVTRWRSIAAAALEQSRGSFLAEVTTHRTVTELATSASGVSAAGSGPALGLVTVPGAPALPDVLAGLGSDDRSLEAVWVAVGPEGGWDDAEVEQLVACGWHPVGLGATVLRSEHAGPVAIAVIAALSGRWRAAASREATPRRGVQGG